MALKAGLLNGDCRSLHNKAWAYFWLGRPGRSPLSGGGIQSAPFGTPIIYGGWSVRGPLVPSPPRALVGW